MERDVLHRQQKFPERLRHLGIFAPRRQQKINSKHDEVGRHDSQRAACEEPTEFDALIARKRREQLATDQIPAKDKEKIDTDPAKPVHTAGQFESEKRGVVNNDYDDRKRPEKIEAGLTFAILKPRINCERQRSYSVAHELWFGDWAEIFQLFASVTKKKFRR